jgi:hypothetical protein
MLASTREFFTVGNDDEHNGGAPGGAPIANYIEHVPAVSGSAFDDLRTDAGLVDFVGRKPITRVLTPNTDPTGAVEFDGMVIPIGVAAFSRAARRPRSS